MSNAVRNLNAKHFIPTAGAVAAISNSAATLLAASSVASIGALNSAKSNFSWMFYIKNKSTTQDVHFNVFNQGDTSTGSHTATLGDRFVGPGQEGFIQVPEGSGQGMASCIADGAAANVVTGWFVRSKG